MTDRILAALAACPEGLTKQQIRDAFWGVTYGNIRSAMPALLADDTVWSLPVVTHRGGVQTLYFIPDPAELARERCRERSAM